MLFGDAQRRWAGAADGERNVADQLGELIDSSFKGAPVAAGADPELQPAARLVQRGRCAREALRLVCGERRDERPEADPTGGVRDSGQALPALVPALEQMVRDPQRLRPREPIDLPPTLDELAPGDVRD